MELPRSGIARLALVVVTAALGLSAMKNNDSFLLGVLTAAVAWWLIAAFLALLRGPRRASWGGFLAIASASLLVSFGPWSDREQRAGAFAWSMDRYKPRITPVSKVIARSMVWIRPLDKGWVYVGVPGTGHEFRAIYWIGPNSLGRAVDIQQNLMNAVVGPVTSGGPFTASWPASTRTNLRGFYTWMPDYQDSGHLLAALLLGSIGGAAGLVVSALQRRPHPCRAPENVPNLGTQAPAINPTTPTRSRSSNRP